MVKLWTRFCSRGYENLSFESRDRGGTLSRVTINGIAWTEDGPFWTTVPPGDETARYGVWTGRISSEEREYALD
jgi:hypothetical protein